VIRLEKGWIEVRLQSLEAATYRTFSLCRSENDAHSGERIVQAHQRTIPSIEEEPGDPEKWPMTLV